MNKKDLHKALSDTEDILVKIELDSNYDLRRISPKWLIRVLKQNHIQLTKYARLLNKLQGTPTSQKLKDK